MPTLEGMYVHKFLSGPRAISRPPPEKTVNDPCGVTRHMPKPNPTAQMFPSDPDVIDRGCAPMSGAVKSVINPPGVIWPTPSTLSPSFCQPKYTLPSGFRVVSSQSVPEGIEYAVVVPSIAIRYMSLTQYQSAPSLPGVMLPSSRPSPAWCPANESHGPEPCCCTTPGITTLSSAVDDGTIGREAHPHNPNATAATSARLSMIISPLQL